jgi:hypothetical protein
MYLGPRHFQVQNRYFEDSIQFAASSLRFAGYGLAGAEWLNGCTVDPEGTQRVQDSFVIDKARKYLAQSAGAGHVYAILPAEAGKNNPPISLNRRYPGSAQVPVETHEVPGAFSKGGWAFMKDAIAHPDRYFGREHWVPDERAAANIDLADGWQPAAQGNTLEWMIRSSNDPRLNGKPLTVRFTLDMAGAPPIFQRGYLSRTSCVAEAAC